jgi:hypothetical protein
LNPGLFLTDALTRFPMKAKPLQRSMPLSTLNAATFDGLSEVTAAAIASRGVAAAARASYFGTGAQMPGYITNFATGFGADPTFTFSTFWSAVSADAAPIEAAEAADTLAGAPLWRNASPVPPYGVPEQLWLLWQELKAALHAANEDWEVWTSWYEDRLAGRIRNEARELAYVRIGDDLWNQGPAAVNAEIKRRIEELEPTPSTVQLGASSAAVMSARLGWTITAPAPPAPVANVPSAISYGWTSQGTITVAAGPQNWPVFPFAGGERDHANRLDACRSLAADIARLPASGRYKCAARIQRDA